MLHVLTELPAEYTQHWCPLAMMKEHTDLSAGVQLMEQLAALGKRSAS